MPHVISQAAQVIARIPRKLFGQLSDAALARRFSCKPSTIRRHRIRFGLPAYDPSFTWTAQMLRKLGRDSDLALAGAWQLNAESVRKRRVELGIPSFRPAPNKQRIWTEGMITALGTLTDEAFGARHGMHKTTVALKRRSLGIPHHANTGPRLRWSAAMQRDLGQILDREFAAKYHIAPSTVRAARLRRALPKPQRGVWPATLLARLGTMSDTALAKLSGYHSETIRLRRTQLGIPVYSGVPAWVERIRSRLGVVNDSELGREVGQDPAMVHYYRKKFAIPRAPMRGRPAQGATAAQARKRRRS